MLAGFLEAGAVTRGSRSGRAPGNAYLLVERSALGGDAAARRGDAALRPAHRRRRRRRAACCEPARRARRAWRSSTPTAPTPRRAATARAWSARLSPSATGAGDVTIATVGRACSATVSTPTAPSRRAMADAALEGPAYRPNGGDFPYPHRFVSVGNPHVTIPVADVRRLPARPRRARRSSTTRGCPSARTSRSTACATDGHDRDARLGARRGRDAGLRLRRLRGRGRGGARRRGRRAPSTCGCRAAPSTIEVGDGLAIRQTGPAARIARVELDAALVERVRGG